LQRPQKGRTPPRPRSPGGFILVGIIGAAHGVRGEVRVKSYTAEPSAIAGYGRLQNAEGTRAFEFEALRLLRDNLFVARIQGVADRNAAEALANTELYVPRDRLVPLAEEEFLHADLIGLKAETRGGTLIGTVVAVQNFGAGDLLEIAPSAGETLFVAFTRMNVPVVDVAGGRLVVEPPHEISRESFD
jgi:16S rRNA processing protein RimM